VGDSPRTASRGLRNRKEKYFVPPLAEQIVNFTKNGIIDNLKEKKKRGQAKCPLLIPHRHYSSVFRG